MQQQSMSWSLVGSGVVSPHSKFNNLNCQTDLSDAAGVKGIFPCRKTQVAKLPRVPIQLGGTNAGSAHTTGLR